MTKQEEIKEATEILEASGCIYGDPSLCQLDGDCSTCYLRFLDDKGVVIKVDRELPRLTITGYKTELNGEYVKADAGYVAVEPLIKEVPDG